MGNRTSLNRTSSLCVVFSGLELLGGFARRLLVCMGRRLCLNYTKRDIHTLVNTADDPRDIQ